ncbi:hypothetical protein AALO_G00174580 [Alosa alosa]|uniref:Uncharacterized protein n=1 Tax=Alosa alosa TaxID=278164 RepID=A0AAV6GDW4_9TELE|nr:hypothetical protein AALO_G00174580 [Alosa alosa]
MEAGNKSNKDNHYRMAQRMDAFEEKMDELLMLLRSSQSPPFAPVDDILLLSCSTVTELQERRNKMPSLQDLYSGT